MSLTGVHGQMVSDSFFSMETMGLGLTINRGGHQLPLSIPFGVGVTSHPAKDRVGIAEACDVPVADLQLWPTSFEMNPFEVEDREWKMLQTKWYARDTHFDRLVSGDGMCVWVSVRE